MRSSWRGRMLAPLLVAVAAGALPACLQARPAAEPERDPVARSCLLSRSVMRVAEDLVRAEAPAPAAAARFYAYVASAYADALEAGSQGAAVATAAEVIGVLYPSRRAEVRRQLAVTAARPCSGAGDQARADVVAKYVRRIETDGADLPSRVRAPEGKNVWSVEGVEPATPRAGEWRRWGVQRHFAIAAPPKIGSAADRAELAKVKAAVAVRDGQWVAKINFWGGTPGTDTPAGIWQNQLFTVLVPDLEPATLQADRTYAAAQAALAQVLADAFMECWKVKFQYWTQRPSARIPDLDIAMNDPPFPSYPSGHAAVSAAAAEVLSTIVPRHAHEWRTMARDAADSRLYAGIHFEVDTVEGAKLGADVGREFVRATGVEALVT